jgi:hypothetical protein
MRVESNPLDGYQAAARCRSRHARAVRSMDPWHRRASPSSPAGRCPVTPAMLRSPIARTVAVDVAEIPRLARPDRFTAPGADSQPRVDRLPHARPDLLMPPAVTLCRRPAHHASAARASCAFFRQCVRFLHRSLWKRCLGADGVNTTEQSSAAHSRAAHISSSRSSSASRLPSRSAHQSHFSIHSSPPPAGPVSRPCRTKRRQRRQ